MDRWELNGREGRGGCEPINVLSMMFWGGRFRDTPHAKCHRRAVDVNVSDRSTLRRDNFRDKRLTTSKSMRKGDSFTAIHDFVLLTLLRCAANPCNLTRKIGPMLHRNSSCTKKSATLQIGMQLHPRFRAQKPQQTDQEFLRSLRWASVLTPSVETASQHAEKIGAVNKQASPPSC